MAQKSTVSAETAEKFMAAFPSFDGGYGQAVIKQTSRERDGKKEAAYKTVKSSVKIEDLIGHLSGDGASIGLIPVLSNNTCRWGAIDIDVYEGLNVLDIEYKIGNFGLPLVICLSKSGGIHLYLFLKEEVAASIVQKALRDWASRLGFSKAEIFPKQLSRKSTDDVGNFLNLPYFNSGDTIRPAIEYGERVSLERFLEIVEERRVDGSALKNFMNLGSDGEAEDVPAYWSEEITEGNRHTEVRKRGVALRNQGYGIGVIAQTLSHVAQNLCKPPMEQTEVQGILDWIEMKVPQGGTIYPLTDQGNGYRFRDRYRGEVLYCTPAKKFMIWDGCRFKWDELQKAKQYAKRTALSMQTEAQAAIVQGAQGRQIAAFAKFSQSRGGLTNMLWAAESELSIHPDQLDRDPDILNIRNGSLDLKTGNLWPHNPEMLLTKLAPVDFVAEADCPVFKRFLETTFAGDQEVIAYVQRVFGYCLTGRTSEHCFFILYGHGRNGKSTILNVLAELLGDYHRKAESKTFLIQRSEGIRNDIAALRGSRVVAASEVADGARFHETTIKEITGGDIISARFLHAEFFEYRPECKIIMAVNVKPEIRGCDDGIWERVRLIPFLHTIPAEARDKDLGDKLRAELSGILNWALEGLASWRNGGLQEPPSIRAARDEYRHEMNIVGRFMAECTYKKQDGIVPASDLYAAWKEWIKGQGEEWFSQRQFGLRLTEMGYRRSKQRIGGKPMAVYLDISLNAKHPAVGNEF